MVHRTHLLIIASLHAFLGCSSSFAPKPCDTDDDCGEGLVCAHEDSQAVCLSAAAAPLRIGMSAPVSGPSQELGLDMRLGISLALDQQNDAGGVRGRKLVLDFRDDAYEPAIAEENTRELLDVLPGKGRARCPTTTMPAVTGEKPVSTTALARGPSAVLALLGNVGTPTMVRSAPIAVETGTLFFGAFTGASKILRDSLAGPCRRYVFNVRGSYAQEARASLEFFFKSKVPDATHLMSFDQDDSFGQAGYDGLVAGYEAIRGGFVPAPADPSTPIARFRYTRDDASSVAEQVDAAAAHLARLLGGDRDHHTVGIFLTATYGPAADFITGLRRWQYANDAQQTNLQKATRLTLYFNNVSFVGSNALASRLQQAGTVASPRGPVPYTDNVLVSQVVPNYESDSSDVVQDYRAAIQKAGATPSFTSLEGYIVARIFIAGLLAHEGPFAPDALVSTFERLPKLSLGLGASAGFSPRSHEYSKSVWGTSIEANATFTSRYFWSEGTPLQLFE